MIFDHLQRQAEIAAAEGRVCLAGCLVVDAAGRIFIQKRSATRRLYPDTWDIVGGHMEGYETLEMCIARELKEETGWDVARVLGSVGSNRWELDGKHYQSFLFLVSAAGDMENPRLETAKVTGFRWIGPQEADIFLENRADRHRYLLRDMALAGFAALTARAA